MIHRIDSFSHRFFDENESVEESEESTSGGQSECSVKSDLFVDWPGHRAAHGRGAHEGEHGEPQTLSLKIIFVSQVRNPGTTVTT